MSAWGAKWSTSTPSATAQTSAPSSGFQLRRIAASGQQPAFALHPHHGAGCGVGERQFHRHGQQRLGAEVQQQQPAAAQHRRQHGAEHGQHRDDNEGAFVGAAGRLQRARGDVAQQIAAGTVGYELMCALAPRVPVSVEE